MIEPNTLREGRAPNAISLEPTTPAQPVAKVRPPRGKRLGRAILVFCLGLMVVGIGGLLVGSPDSIQIAELAIYGALGLSWTLLSLALVLRGVRQVRRSGGLGIASLVHEGALAIGIGAVGLAALLGLLVRMLGFQ